MPWNEKNNGKRAEIMADINSCVFTGRLAKDPELAYTSGGKAKCTFPLAVQDGWGETKHASFFDMAVWGKFAETSSTILKKGNPITCTCRARQNKWQGQDGKWHTRIEFHVQEIRYGFKKDDNANQNSDAQEL